MIIESIIISVAAIVLGGTYMGLKFAKEFDPKLREIEQEKKKSKEGSEAEKELLKARKKVYEAIDKSYDLPATSREIVNTQVRIFPHAFSEEERKRLIAWVNYG